MCRNCLNCLSSAEYPSGVLQQRSAESELMICGMAIACSSQYVFSEIRKNWGLSIYYQAEAMQCLSSVNAVVRIGAWAGTA